MFRNAVEKINKFYDLDLSKNSHADEMFDVLNEIIKFDSAAIFYLAPNSLSLEYGKNFEIYEDIKISSHLSQNLYNENQELLSDDIKRLLNITTPGFLCSRLTVKNAVLGIFVIERKETEFSFDEKLIFKTCAKIIANLIKDLELSKVLKMQVRAMEEGLQETHHAYETIKKQNKKIKTDEKLQNQFIANISHDLRTPLNSIIGFSEALAGKIFGELNKKQQEYVEDIRVSGIRLLGMINEVLDIAKIESHTLKLNYSIIQLNSLIDEVCNILKPLLEKKHLKVTTNIQTDITFTGDYIKLQQVMFNILGNAIKFSDENSQIKIEAYKTIKDIVIKIQDFGIGIEKKYHKKIFNKFFQVNNTTAAQETSTGLGLTVSKEFIKLHNGEITVESEPNKGTTFIITIPHIAES